MTGFDAPQVRSFHRRMHCRIGEDDDIRCHAVDRLQIDTITLQQ